MELRNILRKMALHPSDVNDINVKDSLIVLLHEKLNQLYITLPFEHNSLFENQLLDQRGLF